MNRRFVLVNRVFVTFVSVQNMMVSCGVLDPVQRETNIWFYQGLSIKVLFTPHMNHIQFRTSFNTGSDLWVQNAYNTAAVQQSSADSAVCGYR